MAKPFLYRCPMTGLNVQGMTTDDEAHSAGGRKDRRETVRCPVCGGVHLIDPGQRAQTAAQAGVKSALSHAI
jgi:hypothetical protein